MKKQALPRRSYLRPTRFVCLRDGNGHPGFAVQRDRLLIHADHRVPGIEGLDVRLDLNFQKAFRVSCELRIGFGEPNCFSTWRSARFCASSCRFCFREPGGRFRN
jgi:hypothetical protein